MPWLDVSFDSDKDGKIVGHEGRHRAAALIAEGWRNEPIMPCAIILMGKGKWKEYYAEEWEPKHSKRYLGINDIPTRFLGQFDGHAVEPDLSTFSSFYHAKERLVETTALYPVFSRLETYEATC